MLPITSVCNDSPSFSTKSNQQISSDTLEKSKHFITAKKRADSKVIIGAVCCRNKSTTPINNKYNEQTTVMIKSVLISAKLYNISTIELHLFLEHLEEDKNYFENQIKDMVFHGNGEVGLILKTHSAVDVIPKKYHSHMIYHPRFRCGYVRFFFPSALPEVDSIIHLDSDMIITGNIMKHWRELSKMKGNELIAMGYNRQPENSQFLDLDKRILGDVPHVPPRGVNAGLLIMNLTRMRDFGFEEKIIRAYDDYSKIVPLTGQKVINILLFYNPGLLRIIPCHLHFVFSACEKGFYCESAVQDSDGIHLIHGTYSRFMKGDVFHGVYYYYQHMSNLSSLDVDVFKKRVASPIRRFYSYSKKDWPKCFGTMNTVLFKRFAK